MKNVLVLAMLFVLVAQHAQASAVTDFLRELMGDPARVPVYGEGLKVADQIAAMPASEVTSALPVIFEALSYERDAVKLNAALALHAVALRSDARTLLEPKVADILLLLRRSDDRLKMTAPMVLTKLRLPNERVVPALNRFLLDPTQSGQAKAAVVCTIRQIAPADTTSRQAISRFMDERLTPTNRIDALNAIACQPSDDLETAQIVARNLADENADVRSAAIQVIGRLGPKAIRQSEQALRQIAGRTDERTDVRALAERVVNMKW